MAGIRQNSAFFNRVAGGFSSPAPATPCMRVSPKGTSVGCEQGVSQRLPSRSRVMNVHPLFFDRQKTLILQPLVGHAGLDVARVRASRHGPLLLKFTEMAVFKEVPSLRRFRTLVRQKRHCFQ